MWNIDIPVILSFFPCRRCEKESICFSGGIWPVVSEIVGKREQMRARLPYPASLSEKNTMPHADSQTRHFTDTCLAAEG